MELTKIQFEDGQKVSDAYVEINGVKHNVTKAQYQGKTPLSAKNLNKLQENVGTAISDLDERVVSYRNVLVDEQALIKECGGLKLKKLNKLEGKTEQEVRSGKNLAEISDTLRLKQNKDNIELLAKYDGTKITDISLEAGEYTVSLVLLSKPTTATSITSYLDNTDTSDYYFTNINAYELNKTYTKKITLTKTTQLKYVIWGNTNADLFKFQFQIEKGTVATEYEAYGKAPTPNFPSEVKTVTGDVEVKVGNENLYNTVLEGGSLSNGLNIENPEAVRSKDFVEIKPNTNYAFSVNGILNRIIVSLYDINKKFISTDGSNGLVSADGLFKTYENAHYLRFRCYNADKTLFETGEIQLVEGVKAYQSQVFPLTLGSLELCKIGDYADYIYRNGSKWFKHSEIGKIVFNGTETWSISEATTNNQYYTKVNDKKNTTDNMETGTLISDKFINIPGAIGYGSNTINGISTFATTEIRISLDISIVNRNVEAFKTWLSNNNTTVYYVLETPTDTEITDTTLIAQLNALAEAQLYEGITNITITGDNLTPIADIDYWTWFKGETGDSGNIYSTEEQVIGKWIDGKPLYRKVIETILPETTVNGTIVYENLYFSPYIDNGFIEFAYATNTSNQNVFIPYETDSGYRIKVIFQTDQLIIGNAIASYNGVPVLISVLYTKTTD